jgi:hypothetical protein
MANKLIWTTICAAIILSVLNSCANNKTGEMVTTNAAAETSAETNALDARMKTPDTLPETDLQGIDWRVYAQKEHVNGFFYAEDENGEVVNDAIYYANRTVEERFNFNLVVDYSGNDDNAQPNAIKRLVAAGDNTYSLVTCHDVLGSNLSLENTFVNLYSLNYINFDEPWWHNIEDITVLGQAFMVSSDMTVYQLNGTWALYFNKDIMDDLNLEYPYSSVFDGTWTLDKLIALTKDVYTDVNGDTIQDKDDIYGFGVLPECYGWLDSFGIQTTVKDDDNVLAVNEDIEKMSALLEKTNSWLFGSLGAKSTQVGNYTPNDEFKNGKYMIIYSMIGQSVTNYRFVDNLNYGIVPMVKYDEKQENYISTFLDYPFFVPNVQDAAALDVTGLLIEAFSAQGYRQIVPAYYEIALKVKYAQDDESVKSIEIIHDTTRPSFSWCFENWQGLNRVFYDLNMAKSADYASYEAKKVKTAEARVKLLVKKFEAMEALG